MFRRKRRKPRVVWFHSPGTPITLAAGATALTTSEQPHWGEIQAALPVTGEWLVVEAPLVLDNPVSETEAGASLTVVQSLGLNQEIDFGYRLRRICGSIHCSHSPVDTQSGGGGPLYVSAGIMVRRVDPETGLSLQAQAGLNPSSRETSDDPWVWRRNWILGNPTEPLGSSIRALDEFPHTNAEYGSVREGTFVDQKTARVIGTDERLFINISVLEYPLSGASRATLPFGNNQFVAFWNLRVLGTVRTNQGNRRNANR